MFQEALNRAGEKLAVFSILQLTNFPGGGERDRERARESDRGEVVFSRHFITMIKPGILIISRSFRWCNSPIESGEGARIPPQYYFFCLHDMLAYVPVPLYIRLLYRKYLSIQVAVYFLVV